MSTSRSNLERWEELACDAALFGRASLSDVERDELDVLLIDEGIVGELELTAGEIAAAAFLEQERADDALPEGLAARVVSTLEQTAALQRRESSVERAPRERTADVRPSRLPTSDESRPHGAGDGARVRERSDAMPVRAMTGWLLAAAAIVVAVAGWWRRPDQPVSVPTLSTNATTNPTTSAVANRDVPLADAGASAKPNTAAAREALIALEGTTRNAWKPTKDLAGANASGDVVWHNGVQHGFMHFHGLAANDPRKTQYQLWIFDAERDERYPVDGGVFDVGPDGDAIVPIEAKLHVGKPKLFAITVEPPGGVVVSKRERIVLTASL